MRLLLVTFGIYLIGSFSLAAEKGVLAKMLDCDRAIRALDSTVSGDALDHSAAAGVYNGKP